MTPTHTIGDDVTLYRGDCLAVLPTLAPGSVDEVVTSPPYYLQRDYQHQDQIGQEATVDQYVARLVEVFRWVRRALTRAGTLWLNLGDTRRKKELLGMPWRVALALQADGWILRSEVVWAKQGHKPEKVRDRPTTAHEAVFLLTKIRAGYCYDFDAASEPATGNVARPQWRRAHELAVAAGLTPAHLAAIRSAGATDTGKAMVTQTGTGKNTPEVRRLAAEAKAALKGYYREFLLSDRRNCRSVWSVADTPSKDSHSAVMAGGLADRCVRVGSRPGGVVFDPFAGSGTTLVSAVTNGRKAVGVELDPTHYATALKRLTHATGTGAGQLFGAV